MDFLDVKKQKRNQHMIFVGYALITIAIAIATTILLYQAYGFGIGKNGKVIQNGLVYFSSQPNPANVYLNGVLNSAQTDARLELPENIYHVELSRSGYLPWQRTVDLQGGSVEHFDYPLLIPSKLTNKKIQSYTATPNLITQSPDRRWLVVQPAGDLTSFDIFDLNNPDKPAISGALPTNLLTKATSSESWQLVDWADDNQHLLLQHNYDGKLEYILVDRSNPAQSVNLTTSLSLPTSGISLALDNKKYDHYYLYNQTVDSLQALSLGNSSPQAVLQHVLAYTGYGSNSILYVTADGAVKGKVLIRLTDGDNTYSLHSLPAGSDYLLNLTEYNGTLYVAAGASSENKIYIYKDPIGQLSDNPTQAIVPSQVLHVMAPNYLSFSDNAQFIMTEHDSQFAVYDIQNLKGYNYQSKLPLDSPQLHATWMDGDRLTYVSNSKTVIMDYDGTNQHSLLAASSNFIPAFDPKYHFLYSFALDNGSSQGSLTQTALLIPADQ